MFDFPNTPTTGTTISGPNGAAWTWDGVKWTASQTGGQTVVVSDTAPTSVGVGTLWWDSVGGQLYLLFADPNSTQWVPASNISGAVFSYPSLPVAVQQAPVTFPFAGKPGSGARVNVPVAMAVTVAASLAGSVAFATTLATADATFTVNKLSGGATTALGTVVLHATGSPTLSGAGGSLAIGDVLQVMAPATQDTTLADVGLTLMTMRT